MNRIAITVDLESYPQEFHAILKDTRVFDSSCSPSARVIFVDKDDGYFLKIAKKGMLQREAEMTAFFHQKKFSSEVLAYVSSDKDFLLTRRIQGEDLCHQTYLEDPKRLSEALGEILRVLHESDSSGHTLPDRTKEILTLAEKNYQKGHYDCSLFPDNWGFKTAEEAWYTLEIGKALLKNNTLIHGDYCLPNLLFDNWHFSGLIDLGNSGKGDRHVDLFWGAWSLRFNLKTDAYRERFFSAYGKDRVDGELLRIVAAAEVFG